MRIELWVNGDVKRLWPIEFENTNSTYTAHIERMKQIESFIAELELQPDIASILHTCENCHFYLFINAKKTY